VNVSISHPTDRPNFTEVEVGELTIWFSYRTPVGFMAPGTGRVVRTNIWGPTTGKHLNEIDHGDKASRLTGETFEAQLDAILQGLTFRVDELTLPA
jgi:hypothetical protein